ncbi:hypothetical protein TREES_T100011040 [Tupaia chinensis]|uniref:Uncharacterized protein n=1 Tax=Tupaia chinensis TaxID=246437 RepID=L9JCP4_TUPCH|nr:hypothetical protein TREES_T100011040 [Tupaia chinensis]
MQPIRVLSEVQVSCYTVKVYREAILKPDSGPVYREAILKPDSGPGKFYHNKENGKSKNEKGNGPGFESLVNKPVMVSLLLNDGDDAIL